MLIITVIALIGLASIVIILTNNFKGSVITNFEECIAAGNPAMESYPRQCMANGQTFVEIIDDAWRLDRMVLMQHEFEGYFACFGCKVSFGDESVICIDPIMGMKQVDETFERYCGEGFEVVEL